MKRPWCALVALTAACGAVFGVRYSVKPGEDLASIARAHGVSEEALRHVNRLEPADRVRPGDILFLPRGEAPRGAPAGAPAKSRPRGTEPRADLPSAADAGRDLRPTPGEQRLPTQGPPQQHRARQETVATAVAPPAEKPAAKAEKPLFAWPASGEILRGFGAGPGGENRGVDIGVPAGTPVHAAAAGKVIYAGIPARAYGPVLILEHEDGLHTVYSNLREIHVSRGRAVVARQTVGLSGEKAATALPHVHFEVRRNGDAVDPLLFLPPR